MSQRNVAASIRARLKQHADARQQDFNLTLTHYGLERLLYRLSVSQHAHRYLLKGALLFSLWYDQPHRPTRDADLLGFGPDDVESAVAVFREIGSIEVDDGLVFDVTSVKGSVIRKEAGYSGVRVDLLAALDGARIALQVDIGFGDAVTPAPKLVDYPVLLTEGGLDAAELQRAVEATFARRKLALPLAVPMGLSDAFAQDAAKQRQWSAFLKKNQLQALNLGETVALLRSEFQKLQAG